MIAKGIRSKFIFLSSIIAIILLLTACQGKPWNSPYPSADDQSNIYYASFSEQPKTLDPAKSYSAEESIFLLQIYEPALQYHYLKRPYTLIPLTATTIPKPVYLDASGQVLADQTHPKAIAYSVYTIQIKPGIYYQPHPAFAHNVRGQYYYHRLNADYLSKVNTLGDFPDLGTRELTAEDYVYEIKRLADPRVQSPVYGVLAQHIVGFADFNKMMNTLFNSKSVVDKQAFVDLRYIPLAGVKVLDRYTYSITVKGQYPQFIYWLAMSFFSPVPWEADAFYSQPGQEDNDISFDWYPVGTGPYLLSVNNPNRQMILSRNPNYHGEKFPVEGMPDDYSKGYLKRAGAPLPFVDKFIFTLEKESIPRWNKFLQGYYDQSTISAESFDQSIQIDENGHPDVTPELKNKGIRLQTSTSPSIVYLGFNMLDPIVGGVTEQARKLRLAISIALDSEEYITLFLNGRGTPAQGPIPPGIFGYRSGESGINPYIYHWTTHGPERRTLAEAKNLLAQAGYANGIDPHSGQPLQLNYDIPSGGGGDDRAYFEWLSKQFAKLGIELRIRDTDYNRFQEKVRNGQGQIFTWAWTADYPDPENFLFLLYGPNGKVKYGGENAVNYNNPIYDDLFVKMRDMPNGSDRQAIIDKMVATLQHDAPWDFTFYPRNFVLTHSWVEPLKPNEMSYNTLKYYYIDPIQRAKLRAAWNAPILWPLGILLLILIIAFIPIFILYWKMTYKSLQKN